MPFLASSPESSHISLIPASSPIFHKIINEANHQSLLEKDIGFNKDSFKNTEILNIIRQSLIHGELSEDKITAKELVSEIYKRIERLPKIESSPNIYALYDELEKTVHLNIPSQIYTHEIKAISLDIYSLTNEVLDYVKSSESFNGQNKLFGISEEKLTSKQTQLLIENLQKVYSLLDEAVVRRDDFFKLLEQNKKQESKIALKDLMSCFSKVLLVNDNLKDNISKLGSAKLSGRSFTNKIINFINDKNKKLITINNSLKTNVSKEFADKKEQSSLKLK
jgi:hypothetical protein